MACAASARIHRHKYVLNVKHWRTEQSAIRKAIKVAAIKCPLMLIAGYALRFAYEELLLIFLLSKQYAEMRIRCKPWNHTRNINGPSSLGFSYVSVLIAMVGVEPTCASTIVVFPFLGTHHTP